MHPTGMLDRDQRTAKIPLYFSDKQVPKTTSFRDGTDNSSSSSNRSSIISSSSCCTRTTFLYLNWRKGYLIHSFQRLKNVLLVVVVYLTLITLPRSSSAPTTMTSSRDQQHPKWMNPCGLKNEDTTDFVPALKDSDLRDYLLQISRQAGIALSKADAFKDKFARKTFKSDYDEELYKEQNYNWLPNMLDNPLEKTTKDIDETLLEAYEYLQRLAVGLEQVVWDQLDRPGHFPNEFQEQESYLIAVLCELQMVINEKNIKMRDDIQRNIMSDELRWNTGVTESNARDFIIFRSYRNTLKYVEKVFSHLAKQL